MGGSSGGGGGGTQTMRYAGYIETQHKAFLAKIASCRTELIGSAVDPMMTKTEWITFTFGSANYVHSGNSYSYNVSYYTGGMTHDEWEALQHGGSTTSDTTVAERQAEVDAGYAEYVASYNASINTGKPSPFAHYDNIEVDAAFFGAGYLISSYTSLYEMYGTYMTGINLDTLWADTFEDTVNSAEVRNLVVAEAALMDDDIEINSLPRMQSGMRDINSVVGSSFVVGKAIIEDAKIKALSKFSAELKYRLIPIASARWSTTLDWNKNLVTTYAELMKFYYSAKSDIDEINYTMATKNLLWPFTVLDFERAALGALQGAMTTKTDVAGASTTAKVLSGALSGAAMGAMVGSQISTGASATQIAGGSASTYAGWGSLVGAGLGIASALTY